MCGRYTLGREPESLLEYFHLHGEVPFYHLSYNIAPSQTVPVITQDLDQQRVCMLMQWGLVPHWAKQVQTQYKMINARAETITEKPAYRDAFRKHRCLVPADGFYEWHQSPQGKQPYYIHRQDGGLFAMAGVWSRWESPDMTLLSFAIVTTTANTFMRRIHERMPLILPEADYATWLDPRTDTRLLQGMLQAECSVTLDLHAVSKAVNNPANNEAALVQEVQLA